MSDWRVVPEEVRESKGEERVAKGGVNKKFQVNADDSSDPQSQFAVLFHCGRQ